MRRLYTCLLVLILGSVPLQAAQPGDSAPPWALTDTAGNTQVYPDAGAGRPSIIFFWASWCSYCHHMMPYLQQVQQDYEEFAVTVYAINFQDDVDPAQHMAKHNYGFVVLPGGDDVAREYAVPGSPGLFVVDEQGVIVWRRRKTERKPGGASDQWNEEIRAALDALVYEDE